jgi:hypothetical protein
MKMFLATSFAMGLFVYVRQAALSLDRAPAAFREPMCSYSHTHGLPCPQNVVARLDATLSRRASIWAQVIGKSVSLSERELLEVRDALRDLQMIIDGTAVESNLEKVRMRMALTNVEVLLSKKLGRKVRAVERIAHLNQAPHLWHMKFRDAAGSAWPWKPA